MGREKSERRKRPGPVRWIVRVVVGLVALVVAFVGVNIALMWGDASMSHFRSAEDEERFRQVYDETMALMPEPVETYDIETGFGTVRAYRFEKADADEAYRALEPLVLLPGHSAPTPMWQGTATDLAEGRPVISIDLLGQAGLSVPTAPVADSADQALWLEQTLAGIGADRVHLVGLSFGGWTAMNYTARHPDRVASVSLFDPVFVFSFVSIKAMIAAMLTEFPLMPDAYTEWFTLWTAGGADAGDSAEARIIGAAMETYSVVEPTPEQLTEEQLRGIEVHVQVFVGGESVMHDADAVAETAEATLRHGTVVLKPDASHAIHGEYAEELNARILEFADAHSG